MYAHNVHGQRKLLFTIWLIQDLPTELSKPLSAAPFQLDELKEKRMGLTVPEEKWRTLCRVV